MEPQRTHRAQNWRGGFQTSPYFAVFGSFVVKMSFIECCIDDQ